MKDRPKKHQAFKNKGDSHSFVHVLPIMLNLGFLLDSKILYLHITDLNDRMPRRVRETIQGQAPPRPEMKIQAISLKNFIYKLDFS